MFHAFGTGFAGIITFVLGLIVLSKSRGRAERFVFAWLCLTVFCWFFSYSFMEAETDSHRAVFLARIGHSGVIFVPIAYLHFTRHMLRLPSLAPLYRVYYIVGVVLLYFMWVTDRFIPNVSRHSWGFYPVGSPIMLVHALLVLATAVLCWILFVVHCRRAKQASDFH